jgi:hypothetical protein
MAIIHTCSEIVLFYYRIFLSYDDGKDYIMRIIILGKTKWTWQRVYTGEKKRMHNLTYKTRIGHLKDTD